VHVPLIVRWPGEVADPGSLRRQYHYVTDIAPTIYELIGCEVPEVYLGYEQMPITGTSMAYCLGDVGAPDAKVIQHFEQMGHRALYLDGWKAVTRHEAGVPFDDDVWELYHVAVDPSETEDLAAVEPERLAMMIERWWQEAERHGVLPLDDRTVQLFGARFRERSPHRLDRRYVYRPPMTRIPAQVAAQVGGRSWDLAAVIDRLAGSGGVVYATGNENSGLSLFIIDDRLVFDYNCFGDHHEVISSVPVPVGSSRVGVRFRRSAERRNTTGIATLVIDDVEVGTMTVPFVMRMLTSAGASVGHDHGSPVSTRYADEFPFVGRLELVEIQLIDHRISDADRAAQAAAEERTAMGRQ
jgi:arylsulfatase